MIVLYFYTNTFPERCAVPDMAVFYSYLMCFLGMLLRYFLNYSGMAPAVPYFYWYHSCCYIPRAQLFLLHGLHILKIFGFFLDLISFS